MDFLLESLENTIKNKPKFELNFSMKSLLKSFHGYSQKIRFIFDNERVVKENIRSEISILENSF